MSHIKKLYRSRDNKIVSGVLGGVGEYFNVDPVIIRIVFVLLLAVSRVIPMVLLYALMLIVVPLEPDIVIVADEPKKE